MLGVDHPNGLVQEKRNGGPDDEGLTVLQQERVGGFKVERPRCFVVGAREGTLVGAKCEIDVEVKKRMDGARQLPGDLIDGFACRRACLGALRPSGVIARPTRRRHGSL